MRTAVSSAALIAACFAAQLSGAAEPIKSGLQPGATIDSIFEPLNVTGPEAGDRHCLVCENGAAPVVMIFARAANDALVRLLAKVNAATERHRTQQLGSFIVFLSDDEGLAERLKTTAAENKWEHIVLSMDSPPGPEGFDVAADADVTVVLYCNYRVLANHAFRPGELNDAAIDKILDDLPKILTAK